MYLILYGTSNEKHRLEPVHCVLTEINKRGILPKGYKML